jgi:hypothetical protein
MPGGAVMIFTDWRGMADVALLASVAGLRPYTCIAWVGHRPGTGGLFKKAWDPILLAFKGDPGPGGRAMVNDVVNAEYPRERIHPEQRPVRVFEHVFPGVAGERGLVLDPFAGSAASARAAAALRLRWAGCDNDPIYCGPVI